MKRDVFVSYAFFNGTENEKKGDGFGNATVEVEGIFDWNAILNIQNQLAERYKTDKVVLMWWTYLPTADRGSNGDG